MGERRAIVIGTGFGGAVVACRLAQAKVRVTILERGRRYEAGDFPRLELPRSVPEDERALPDTSRWRYSEDQGLWDVRDLKGLHVASAAGYGGGSLIYANVHLRPPPEAFEGWPQPYRRKELEPYYDRVARMLELKTIQESPFKALPKTVGFQDVAKKLKREVIYPPLAINFDDPELPPKPNRFGRLQQGCNACGECDIGCQRLSKNTLDLNYLALAEDAGAQVRTLAEVRSIKRLDSGDYQVRYLDHLRAGEAAYEEAPWVFLCAGAVGSTELLLRSQKRGLAPLSPALGVGFFPNADAIAMVYDTEERLAPSEGPTITASVLYERAEVVKDAGPAHQHWFLLQEGGFPPSLAPLFGLFKGAIWTDRNRFNDGQSAERIEAVRERAGELGTFAFEPGLQPLRDDALGRSARFAERLARSSQGRMLDDLDALLPPRREHERPEGDWRRYVPQQAQQVLEELSLFLSTYWRLEISQVTREVREALVEERTEALMKILRKLPISDASIRPRARRLVCWVFDRLAGGDAIYNASTEVFKDRYLTLEFALRVLVYILIEKTPDENTMMLLCMGRDPAPHRLRLSERGRLYTTAPDAATSASVYAEQELLMRDFAEALGGELRTNPLWTLQKRPVTVHAQGGCRMGHDPRRSVVNPQGEVHGLKGLFVIDGAIFPSAVGVNPSSTIAAIAERCVEALLQENLGVEPAAEQPLSEEEQLKLNSLPTAGASTKSAPVGIRFEERMQGFLCPAEDGDDEHEEAERQGRADGLACALSLSGHIEELDAFLESAANVVKLKGKAVVRLKPKAEPRVLDAQGHLRLLIPSGARSRRMIYTLKLEEGLVLHGEKELFDDPGLDAWADTTTLRVELRDAEQRWLGVLRVSIDHFLNEQLPSFEVTGTEDPARIGLALGRFGRFFFGELAAVYLPDTLRSTATGLFGTAP